MRNAGYAQVTSHTPMPLWNPSADLQFQKRIGKRSY